MAEGQGNGKEFFPEELKSTPESGVEVEFILLFYRLFKNATLHDRNNAMISRLIEECLQSVNPYIASEGRLCLKMVRENFFLNNLRIAIKADKYALYRALSQELAGRGIGELEFTQGINPREMKHFVFLLAGLGASFLMAQVLARPLVRITEVARRVAAGQEQGAPGLPLDRKDEAGVLATAFRQMLDRPLKEHQHRYERRKVREYLRLADWLAEA